MDIESLPESDLNLVGLGLGAAAGATGGAIVGSILGYIRGYLFGKYLGQYLAYMINHPNPKKAGEHWGEMCGQINCIVSIMYYSLEGAKIGAVAGSAIQDILKNNCHQI